MEPRAQKPAEDWCSKCPLAERECAWALPKNALDLIKRQKAEIECTKQMLEAAIAGQESLQRLLDETKGI